jgi:16S rRNA (cytosine967-C5)-methyltransferase
LARDPEGKWSLTLKEYKNLLSVQANILNTASKLVKSYGTLLYATCSILEDENQTQIKNFLKNSNEWIFQEEKLFIPNELGDGFYYSILKKK